MATRGKTSHSSVPATAKTTALARRFKTGQRRSDFSYRVLSDMVLEGMDLSHSMFSGAVLRKCTFRNVNFYRCDFDAVRIERCHFENCNMSGDFRASTIAASTFIDCLLDKSLVTETLFDRCDFERVTFADSAVTNNRFIDSSMRGCSFRMSTYLKNIVLRTSFADTFMGDCTLRYVIMRACSFRRCVMNLESIGMIFGLRPEDMHDFDYMYRGVPQTIPDGVELIDLLIREYKERKWDLGVAILQINAHLASAVSAWHDYFSDLLSSHRRRLPINSEELTFVATLFEELFLTQDLPLYSSFEAVEAAAKLVKQYPQSSSAASRETRRWIQDFAARVTTILHQQLDALHREPLQRALETEDTAVEAVVDFKREPRVSAAAVVRRAVELSGMRVADSTRTISQEHASFHEYLETTVHSLVMLQVVIFLVNGSIIGMTEVKERLRVLLRRKPSKEFEELARSPKPPLPAFLAGPLQHLMRNAFRLQITSEEDLAGYSNDNITGARIIGFPKERVSTRRRRGRPPTGSRPRGRKRGS